MMNRVSVGMIGEMMNCSVSEKNHLYVGLCGTQYVGSDRYACVITEILTPKSVRVDWMHDEDYEHNRAIDENGNEFILDTSKYVHKNWQTGNYEISGKVFKLRKNKRWIQAGQGLWGTGAVHFGEADNYRDPSF